MNFLLPVLSAILQAGSFTLDKVVLSFRRVTFKTYLGISFPLIFLINLVIFFIFQPPFSFEWFSERLLWLLILSVFLSIVTNLLFYRALDEDKLGEIQTFSLLSYIPIIIFASIVFTSERNFFVILPAIFASSAIILSHWERRHLKIAKDTRAFLVWSLAIAPISASVSKALLSQWNPISLELVRSGIIAVALFPLFSKQLKSVSFKAFFLLLVTNILTAIAWILFYFSYQRSGIVYTILIFSLQPLLVYFASVFILKEKLSWKKNIAFFVVLASIITAQLLQ